LLDDGTYLVFGGSKDGSFPDTDCFIYDPTTYDYTTTGALPADIRAFAYTKLDDGKVLAVGGHVAGGAGSVNAYLYDPGLGTWSTVPGGMDQQRGVNGSFFFGPQATKLGDGKVLVYGCSTASGTQTSQLYDPVGNSFAVGVVTTGVTFCNSPGILGLDGNVYVFGGDSGCTNDNKVSRYNTGAGTWSGQISTFPTTLAGGGDHRVALLPSGKIAVIGGADLPNAPGDRPSSLFVQIYDPTLNTWAAGASLSDGAVCASLSVLSTGKVQRSAAHHGLYAVLPSYRYYNGAYTTEQYDEGLDAWTALDPRQMTTYYGWYPDNGTFGGAAQAADVLPGDIIFIISGEGGFFSDTGLEQYRP
jgi:hypothetical protein